jgi:hypothetical protein
VDNAAFANRVVLACSAQAALSNLAEKWRAAAMAKALRAFRLAVGATILMSLTAFVSLATFIAGGSFFASLFGW